MAFGSLLALLDDIATVLDDVAAMSKIAAKKTSGVLGDDLALNAQQVTGIRAERELPVVWAVTKGSLKNKLILVPAALIISAVMPDAVLWLLMLGGAYLCFEGAEKIIHSLFHHSADDEHSNRQKALLQSDDDLLAFEAEKIKGAVRTDFILSAEIIVITLGSVANAAFSVQVMVVSALAVAFTFGVYGIVAAIVKLDDAGYWLAQRSLMIWQWLGRGLLMLAPVLMKLLSLVGTVAMFLVGGGIILHGVPTLAEPVHAIEHALLHWVPEQAGWMPLAAAGTSLLVTLVSGFVAGVILVVAMSGISRLRASRS
ncbi:DUF808 domain-containing protein [Thalassolituus sp. LLYu03]|uniref:DUF808 domain-containing protein n=1 Tax=Thalassolituus sp. LLYu03 TaxID=3421656 RepID=UPI003D2D4F27